MASKSNLSKTARYEPQKIEGKWQKFWKTKKIYKAQNTSEKVKKYILVEFPYPSGDLHMGHWYAFAPADVYARFLRMQGYEVMFPIGFDAFGLPAENAAIQRGIHPKNWTYKNIKTMTKQFETMGLSFDWDRVVISSDAQYYKWTQWIFIQMYKKGLAYRSDVTANWCPKCQTVLANEQVENGKCWRHTDTQVIQKKVPQWLLKITAYADKLIWDSKLQKRISWPQSVIEGQNNWIGRSEGTQIEFRIENTKLCIKTFTTRIDTIFGVTFLVLAPEHPFVAELLKIKNQKFKIKNLIQRYIDASSKKTELERKENKEKTGVFTGLYAINPLSMKKIPIWIADYVLSSYSTGAIMAVPAHDNRDFEFAKKYGLEIKQVIKPQMENGKCKMKNAAYEAEGTLVNSGPFTSLTSQEARQKITNYLKTNKLGGPKVEYHLHDWCISRQRYWGAPIPIIHCQDCARLDPPGQGIVPVPEKDLPVELPYKVDYTPHGKSPLASAKTWMKVECPNCGKQAQRDTDTMDTFVDSSWYFLRYASPNYKKAFADPKLIKKWLPVDVYFGGPEHTLGHTLYARFFTKVLHDLGHLPFDEFTLKRVHHGIILGPDGARMSKSRGNVVSPDEQVKKYGADTVRLYLCFMAPHDAGGPWDTSGIMGVYRFLQKVSDLATNNRNLVLVEKEDAQKVLTMTHKTIQKVTQDIESLKFNTAISALMIYVNFLKSKVQTAQKAIGQIGRVEWDEALRTLILLLAPFAPHITEELWNGLQTTDHRLQPRQTLMQQKETSVVRSRNAESVHLHPWPFFDPSLVEEQTLEIAVQVNGKLRGTVSSNAGATQSEVEKQALNLSSVNRHIGGKNIQKTISVPGKLINFVTS